jgi:hypothetical protein
MTIPTELTLDQVTRPISAGLGWEYPGLLASPVSPFGLTQNYLFDSSLSIKRTLSPALNSPGGAGTPIVERSLLRKMNNTMPALLGT